MGTVAESALLTIGDPSATLTTGKLVDERHCLETEVAMVDGLKDSGCKNGSSQEERIRYTKDFIIECFRHPACSRKPVFELPNLSCILSVGRFGATPFTTLYVPPRRKDENGRREPEDNISLRPHSGNFSSGCAPNLSPSHYPQGQFNRFQFHHDDPSKNMYERGSGYQRNNYRFNNNVRQEPNDRSRADRDRDDPRDRRDRDPDKRDVRNNRHPNQSRRPNSILWGPEAENQPEWTRRRGANPDKEHRGRSSYGKDKYGGHYREQEDESEPSWFSEGPTSQHETIELHGFEGDERRDREQGLAKESLEQRDQSQSDRSSTVEPAAIVSSRLEDCGTESKPNELDLSLEKILTMDRISGILPNGLFEDAEQPTGSSRFSQIFHRNSSTAARPEIQPSFENRDDKPARMPSGVNLQALFAPKTDSVSSPSESKSDVIKGMETELRQILLRSSEVPEPPKDQTKQEDLNAFKKLLEDLVIKSNKTAPRKVEAQLTDKSSGRPVTGPPPGLQGIPFNPFGLGTTQSQPQSQSRPLQPINNIVPTLPMNQLASSHPLNRLVEQQHESVVQSQKRSGTPILAALTPTAVMRKMTAEQQPKTGASVVNVNVSSYGGIPASSSIPSAFSSSNIVSSSNVSVPRQLNPLSSFVSAMAQNQSQHLAQPQPMSTQVNHLGHPPHPGHVPLPYAGFHPQRGHFPIVPNSGIPAQFAPYGVPYYNAPLRHRK